MSRSRFAERYYAVLLLAYPAAFRARYGRDATLLFAELHAEVRGVGGGLAVARLWVRAAVSVLWHGLAERFGPTRGARATIAPFTEAGSERATSSDNGGNRGGASALDILRADVRVSLRSLARRPAYSLAAIGLIALGVGAATTVYSVVDGVLLRPLPYPDASRLVTFAKGTSALPIPDYEDMRDGTRSFIEWAASWDVPAVLTDAGEPVRLQIARVTPRLLPMLGARPLRGRFPDSTNAHEAVLSHSLWRTRFGGDDAVLNGTVTLDGEPYAVVGVLDPAYSAPEALRLDDVDIYVPLDLSQNEWRYRSILILSALARLRDGVTVESGRSELAGLAARLAEAYPREWRRTDGEPIEILAESLEVATIGDIGGTLYMFLAAVGLMLLIACANVANLSLARAADRDLETAVRTALGAGRARIVSHVLTESLVIGLAGGALGFMLARIGVAAFHVFEPGGIPRVAEIGIDIRLLLFAIALSIATALIFGLAPAMSSAAVGPRGVLGEGARSTTASRGRARFRHGLVVAEIALALTLLAAAGVLFHGFVLLRAEPTGFRPRGMLTATLDAENDVAPERRASFVRSILDRVRATPGVQSVAASWQLPFARGRCCFRSSAWAVAPPGDTVGAYIHPVTSNYFATLGATIVAGRTLTDADQSAGALPAPGPTDPDAAPAALPSRVPAVINRIVAEQLWPGQPAVGRRLRSVSFQQTEFEVVGVVEPIRHWSLATESGNDVYVPFGSFATWLGLADIAIRYEGPVAPIARAVREAVRAEAPDLPIDGVQTMEERIARSVATPRFFATMLLAFAATALLLAAAGVYGTMLYTVSRRRREFGIRLALGAHTLDLTRLVLSRALALIAVGVALGLAGAFAFTRVLNSLVYEVSVLDPTSLVIAASVLTATALIACWVPARKAGRLDPMTTLRAE